jgi:hypothetical protein
MAILERLSIEENSPNNFEGFHIRLKNLRKIRRAKVEDIAEFLNIFIIDQSFIFFH